MSTSEIDQRQVFVTSLAPSTTKEDLEKFFSFCGKISDITFHEKEATILFEKNSAAKTALMLNGGTLDGTQIAVTSKAGADEQKHDEDDHEPAADDVPFHQHDKPRAAIAAEYLASGYSFTDPMIQRFIDMDAQHGISKRFQTWFGSINTTVGSKVLGPDQTVTGKVQSTFTGVSNKARAVDEQKGISKTAYSYYEKALSSPYGKSVLNFYTTTSNQIKDIHEEARRIADSKKATTTDPASTSSPPATAQSAGAGAGAGDAAAAPTTAAPLAI